MGISNHLKSIEYYVPSIDFNLYEISNVEKYFKNTNKQHVLYCNNIPLSGHCGLFDMDSILEKLITIFPDINFIVSNKFKNIEAKNVIFAEDIIGPVQENNLYEISYLSTFCTSIIGRSSGPYSFSITKDTIKSKKFICMCNSWTDCWYLPDTTNIAWTDNRDDNYLVDFIKKELV